MFINYRRLFNLRFQHDYFENGRPDGLNLYPTSASLMKLKGGKMLFKRQPYGITVLYRAGEDEETPIVPLEELHLRFALTIQDPTRFQTITNLDESPLKRYRSSNILLFRNDPANHTDDAGKPEQINHTLIDSVRSSLFTYIQFPEDPPDTLLFRLENSQGIQVSPGRDADGEPLQTEIALSKLEDGSFRQQIDLRNRKPGFYKISLRESADDTELQNEQKIYVDDELAGQKLLGILELTCGSDDGKLYDKIQEYSLHYSQRESFWKYMIINKNKQVNSPEDLVIVDDGSEDSDTYTPTSFIRLDEETGDPIKINGLDTFIFRSEDPIPFYEIPRTKVQLKEDGGNVLIKHLPNPSIATTTKIAEDTSEPESEIHVYI